MKRIFKFALGGVPVGLHRRHGPARLSGPQRSRPLSARTAMKDTAAIPAFA